MPEGDPRWLALTAADVIAILVGGVVLVTERAVTGYVIALAGTLLFVAMWTLRRKPTNRLSARFFGRSSGSQPVAPEDFVAERYSGFSHVTDPPLSTPAFRDP